MFSSSASFEISTAGSQVSRAAPSATHWLPTASLDHSPSLRFIEAASSSAFFASSRSLFSANSGPIDFQSDPPRGLGLRGTFLCYEGSRSNDKTIQRLRHFVSLRFLPQHGLWHSRPSVQSVESSAKSWMLHPAQIIAMKDRSRSSLRKMGQIQCLDLPHPASSLEGETEP